ncbi:MAG: hypothetical protein HYV07_18130 [Deltaproteobacteria bacterium]|nr:hypothetical protein [Deltaproteobacteria bacterium]
MSERQPAPAYKHHLVFLDARGHTGTKHVVFGAFVLPWERRGDFSRRVSALAPRGAELSAPEARDELLDELVDDVFQRKWLSFRALVSKPGPPIETLRASALARIVQSTATKRLTEDPATTWRVRTGEEVPGLALALGPLAGSVELRRARARLGIDLAHLFASAIALGWDRRGGNPALHQVTERIARNLGWSDLAADTPAEEWKVNVAFVEDPTQAFDRRGTARSVQLRLPLLD